MTKLPKKTQVTIRDRTYMFHYSKVLHVYLIFIAVAYNGQKREFYIGKAHTSSAVNFDYLKLRKRLRKIVIELEQRFSMLFLQGHLCWSSFTHIARMESVVKLPHILPNPWYETTIYPHELT